MIIGLSGKLGSGKDAACERLRLLTSQPVFRVSFADKMKQSSAALLGCTVEDLDRWKRTPDVFVGIGDQFGFFRDKKQTVRSFLQRFGTEAHRDVFGEDFWVDMTLPIPSHLEYGMYDDGLYVVTDVRFNNEAERVRQLGGVVVTVIGPDNVVDLHATEAGLWDHLIDYTIFNKVRDDEFTHLDHALRWLLDEIGVAA